MGSLGFQEILLILVVALLLFGPRKLPELGKTIGRALAEFRSASRDFQAGLEREVEQQRLEEKRTALPAPPADTRPRPAAGAAAPPEDEPPAVRS